MSWKRWVLLLLFALAILGLFGCSGDSTTGVASPQVRRVSSAAAPTAASQEQVQKAYIAYYGRPADPGGLAYWAGRLDDSGGDWGPVIESFGNSSEASALLAGLSSEQKIDKLYNQMFGRSADPEGRAYYANGLSNGSFTLASLAINIINGVSGANADATAVANKLAAARLYTASLNTDAKAAAYTVATVSMVQEWLAAVTATAATQESVDSLVNRIALGATDPFKGTILLGSPTATSIKVNLFSPDQSGTVRIMYGTSPGIYDGQTAPAALTAGKPLELSMGGLIGHTRYYYKLSYQSPDGAAAVLTEEHSFHTARPAGSTFTFTVQADSHLDGNSNLDLYRQTLANVMADTPDFHVDLGDTFMCEKHSAPLTAVTQTAPDQATVDARYAYDRANFDIITRSVPLFLVNGNHEGELGWLATGKSDNIAIWATRARQSFFLNPTPDGFYSGDPTEEPFVGKRASWYSWHWGDALFVVLDPYWYTKTKSNSDGWIYTLGDRQYQWLQETLAASPAKFKFVFIHSLVGGLDGQIRGGMEAAPYFEWGGRNLDGTMGFSQKRPGWRMPIHQLLVQHGVTAVFHGHDHLYARQELDGVVYQEVPQPSAINFQSGATLAAEYHYTAGTILSSSGHLRITVGPNGVIAQYVRAWLPKNQTAQRINGQVDDTWSIGLP